MEILSTIQDEFLKIINDLYDVEVTHNQVPISETRKEFRGDYTLVVFPLVKLLKKNPVEIGNALGKELTIRMESVTDFNVIKGFLNFSLSESHWLSIFRKLNSQGVNFPKRNEKIIIEFSSPNTNKPLHLGHIRNILLGWASSQIQSRYGNTVIKTQIVNDRGIAICKSMLAWQKFGNGATPESTQTKADHFVGNYYVLFEQKFQEEYTNWKQTDEAKSILDDKKKENQEVEAFWKAFKNTYFNEFSELGAEAKQMLIEWEKENPEVRDLWNKMNDWVYSGFDETYKKMGVDFDTLYYESSTYKLGKKLIEEALSKGIFYKKDDGSVWIDLEDDGLDHKLVLRSDGTSVYMTQDIGTAHKRYEDTGADGMVYVVADEQNYHFKALFSILKKLGEPYADNLYHLNYGMVDLPTGRMKSREGTVVDADDLMEEVISVAKQNADERGELVDLLEDEQKEIYKKIGLAALKFFILKVNPKKRMVFNPEESVDMQGTTGPYVCYAYVRLQSMLNKAKQDNFDFTQSSYQNLEDTELQTIKLLNQYKESIGQAAQDYDPSVIAMYAYELAKATHKFIHDVRILNAETTDAKAFRLMLGNTITTTLKDSFNLLGIEMPEKM